MVDTWGHMRWQWPSTHFWYNWWALLLVPSRNEIWPLNRLCLSLSTFTIAWIICTTLVCLNMVNTLQIKLYIVGTMIIPLYHSSKPWVLQLYMKATKNNGLACWTLSSTSWDFGIWTRPCGWYRMILLFTTKHVSPKGFSHGHGLSLMCVHRPFSVWRILILPQETNLSLPESGKQKI